MNSVDPNELWAALEATRRDIATTNHYLPSRTSHERIKADMERLDQLAAEEEKLLRQLAELEKTAKR